MKTEIKPAVAFGIGGALVLVLILGYFFIQNRAPAVVDITKLPQSAREDRNPPMPGQAGYRERTTDPPLAAGNGGPAGRPGDQGG